MSEFPLTHLGSGWEGVRVAISLFYSRIVSVHSNHAYTKREKPLSRTSLSGIALIAAGGFKMPRTKYLEMQLERLKQECIL